MNRFSSETGSFSIVYSIVVIPYLFLMVAWPPSIFPKNTIVFATPSPLTMASAWHLALSILKPQLTSLSILRLQFAAHRSQRSFSSPGIEGLALTTLSGSRSGSCPGTRKSPRWQMTGSFFRFPVFKD